MSWADAIQNVLTKGIDAAQAVQVTKLQVSDPTYNSVGPNGTGGRAGQGTYTGVLGNTSPVVLIGGAAVLLLVGFMLLRK